MRQGGTQGSEHKISFVFSAQYTLVELADLSRVEVDENLIIIEDWQSMLVIF